MYYVLILVFGAICKFDKHFLKIIYYIYFLLLLQNSKTMDEMLSQIDVDKLVIEVS